MAEHALLCITGFGPEKPVGLLFSRIEDTDAERSTEASVQEILDGLKWLGLNWDEGPNFQTANLPDHLDAAKKLLESGHAYRCFCTKEELDAKRQNAEAQKVRVYVNGTCRKISEVQLQDNLARGLPT